jgi:hypothetical protein
MPQQQPATTINHIVGLDLGQTTDFSALAALERSQTGDEPAQYACRDLRRWPLGTPYPRIVADVLAFMSHSALIEPVLVVDQTGVGRAVVDMFRGRVECIFEPITITAGSTPSRAENGDRHVPKKDLVGVLQTLLCERRLHVAPTLKDAAVLVKELQNFQVKVTLSANETFGAPWRDGAHDDLVLALAVGAWIGENGGFTPWVFEPHPRSRSMMSRLAAEMGFGSDMDDNDPRREGSEGMSFPWR